MTVQKQAFTIIFLALIMQLAQAGFECIIQYQCQSQFKNMREECFQQLKKCYRESGGQKNFDGVLYVNCLYEQSSTCSLAIQLASCTYDKCLTTDDLRRYFDEYSS